MFPVGVDRNETGAGMPETMRRYQLRGTPSLLVIDRAGRVRSCVLGQTEDLVLGSLLGRLIDEPAVDGAT